MRKVKLYRNAPAAIAVMALAFAAASATRSQPAAPTGQDFVVAAAGADNFEIMSAHVALIQSSSPAVRGFAKEMIQDHTAAREVLANAAARSGIARPSLAMGAQEAAFLAALQGVGLADFDHLYIRDQGLAQISALATETGYARTGADPNLRNAAAADLPMIRRHLQEIGALGGPTRP